VRRYRVILARCLIILGWTLGGPVGAVIGWNIGIEYSPDGFIYYAPPYEYGILGFLIGWTCSSVFLAIVLRSMYPSMRLKHILLVSLGWVLGITPIGCILSLPWLL
jgi:hypothetical protein